MKPQIDISIPVMVSAAQWRDVEHALAELEAAIAKALADGSLMTLQPL
jgi:hypothetical protein